MSRTVLIGLDGGTFSIFGPLMKQGVMPRLAELAARGVSSDLLSTPNPLTPPAWASLMTGRSPGHHGIFDFIRAEERQHGIYFTMNSSRDIRCETIWSIASRQGRRVTCLNFFGTYPPRPVNGHMIGGFVPRRHLRRAVHPPGLYEQLRKLAGFDGSELAMDLDLEKRSVQGMPPEQYGEWISVHTRRERQWFEVLRHLMTQEPSDLTAVVFDGVDKLQHLAWRLLDPASFPAAPSAWESQIREMCLGYFRQIDIFIGEIVAMAGADARIFIASDHGFGPSTEVFYLNVWLQRNGYLSWNPEAIEDTTGKLTTERLKNHVALLDWSRTRAYALTPSSNGIYIRPRRADCPAGVPPEEYDAFRTKLARELLAYKDPATGDAVVRRVQFREEAYPGAEMERAPDLLLTLRDGGFVSILNAESPLKARPEPVGTHRPEGIFLAAGPGITKGAQLPPISILTIAPALLYSLGLPLPADLDATVPAGVFTAAHMREHPVQTGDATLPQDHFLTKGGSPIGKAGDGSVKADAPQEAAADDAEADAEVLERLRALGYIE